MIRRNMKKLILLFFLTTFSVCGFGQINTKSQMQKLQFAEMAIRELYVDTVNEQQLVEDAIRGMIEKLDPHSAYTSPKQTQSLNEPLEGSFEGIGIQFNMAEDTLLIIQPVNNGPSEKVGIMAGDRIVSVDGKNIAGVKMPRENIMKMLRGKKGTKVKLGIVRRGIKDMLTFTVTRDKIPLKTLEAAYMIKPGVGYIRIGSFGAKTYDEFMTAADSLKKHGMKDIIIDLQENGGGYLQSAVEIADEFLQNHDLIVYTQGRRQDRHEYRAHSKGLMKSGKVVVLVNEYSASAAEILTGAIQDQDRGEVVGRRTFGKGLVQRPISFNDGSMMRLTVAHYYTPSGRCIQKPYKKGDSSSYAEDIEKRFKHGELYSADSIHFDNSLKYYTIRKHRTVYGGGGIMPDYFVPLDTTQYTRFHRMLVARGVIINANLKYTDNHRKELKQRYNTFADFKKNYVVPQSLIDDVVKDAEKLKIKPKDKVELQSSIPMIKLQIKALIARDLWDMSEYFEIINEQSDIVKKALTLF